MSASFRHFVRRTLPLALAAVVAVAALAGCGSMTDITRFVDPYRTDVVQGNFVSKEQVDALQPGMSRQQVRDILGTPLLTSIFHQDRWEYVFTHQRRKAGTQEYRMTVFFKGDQLERVEGDTMPTEVEFVANFDSVRKAGKVPVLEASEDALSKYPPPAPSAAPTVEPAARSSYPPLEGPAR